MAFIAPMLAALPAGLGTAMSIAGTVIGAVGTIQSANAASAAATHSANVADRDAVVADQNRQLTIRQARIDADDKRRDNRRIMSSIRTQYGSSGLELAGSPLDVLEDTAIEQELDVRRVEFEGRVRGREGALRMLGLEESATMSRMEASSAKSAGVIGALGGISSGIGKTLTRVG